jgi:tetratricopeptide (TPR) repeat protein
MTPSPLLRRAPLALALGLVLLAGACQRQAAPTPAAATPAKPAATAPVAAGSTAEGSHLTAVDDFDAGMAKAKAEGKAVLVDAWAPWCHTCLSMQNYVINDPSLASLASRVVLVELDTDKPENAKFLETYKVSVWPTFFVIDPASGQATGLWPGSASVREFRGFVEDGLAGIEVAHAGGDDGKSPAHHMVAAKAAQAAGQYAVAAKHYEEAVGVADAAWPRRSEALMGWLFSLDQAGDAATCVRVGRAHLAEVQGAAVPADYSATLLSCAGDEKAGPDAKAATADALARLRAFTASPPADASADDRADAWNILGATLADAGDKDGARHAQEMRLAILEKAAAGIEDPLLAQTYDYALAQAYVALDRGDDAVKMLEAREKELPTSYEPPARLGSALAKMGRLPQAVAAYDRAIAKSYGPRQLLYFKQKADAQKLMGDIPGQVATLRAQVAAYEALGKGHADPEGLAAAKQRLAEAEQKRGT